MSGWNPSPLVLAGAAVALVRFGHAFARLRRRGRRDHAGWDRAALLASGLALGVVASSAPFADRTLSGHMLEHVVIGDAAPALLVLAVRGPLLFFLLPAPVVHSVARSAPLRRAARLLSRPWLALGAWALAYAAWHVPAAYDFAAAHETTHALEHVSFLLAGVLVWTQLIDPAGRRELSVVARLAFAGALFGAGQILSDVLLLAPGPLYSAYPSLKDQQLAGLVMMVEQFVTLGACAALLVRASLRDAATPAHA
jgi:cytochrome c oxidase assembly factor CtaG